MDARDAMTLISGLREYGYAIEDVFPHAAERRRYTLLQAAIAVIAMRATSRDSLFSITGDIAFAESILAEIESREGK